MEDMAKVGRLAARKAAWVVVGVVIAIAAIAAVAYAQGVGGGGGSDPQPAFSDLDLGSFRRMDLAMTIYPSVRADGILAYRWVGASTHKVFSSGDFVFEVTPENRLVMGDNGTAEGVFYEVKDILGYVFDAGNQFFYGVQALHHIDHTVSGGYDRGGVRIDFSPTVNVDKDAGESRAAKALAKGTVVLGYELEIRMRSDFQGRMVAFLRFYSNVPLCSGIYEAGIYECYSDSIDHILEAREAVEAMEGRLLRYAIEEMARVGTLEKGIGRASLGIKSFIPENMPANCKLADFGPEFICETPPLVEIGKISVSVSPHTPKSALVAVGSMGMENVLTLAVDVTAAIEDAILNTIPITIEADTVNGIDNIAALRLYDGETQIGHTVFPTGSNKGSSITVLFQVGGIEVQKGATKTFLLRVDTTGISNGADSGETLRFYLADVTGSANGVDAGLVAIGRDSASYLMSSPGSVNPENPENFGEFSIVQSRPVFALCTTSNCSKASPSGLLVPGVVEVLRFRIAAEGEEVIFGGDNSLDFRILQQGGTDEARRVAWYEEGNLVPIRDSAGNLTAPGFGFVVLDITIPKGTYKEYYMVVDLQDYTTTGEFFRLDVGGGQHEEGWISWSDGVQKSIRSGSLTPGLPVIGGTLAK